LRERWFQVSDVAELRVFATGGGVEEDGREDAAGAELVDDHVGHAHGDDIFAGLYRGGGVELEWIDRGAVANADGLPVDPDLGQLVDSAAPKEDALARR